MGVPMTITFVSEAEYELHGVRLPDWSSRSFCVFDLEGTGIHFETECITQIGAVFVDEGEDRAAESFESLVRSPKPIPQAIERLTGISNEAMAGAPEFPDAYERFRRFVGNAVLVTQAGYEYDVPMLEKHCRRYGLPMFDNVVLDTKALFTNIHPDIPDVVSTDFLIRYYGIDASGFKRHDALGDCRLIAAIFRHIAKEYEERSFRERVIDGLRVKRFRIPGMYRAEGTGD